MTIFESPSFVIVTLAKHSSNSHWNLIVITLPELIYYFRNCWAYEVWSCQRRICTPNHASAFPAPKFSPICRTCDCCFLGDPYSCTTDSSIFQIHWYCSRNETDTSTGCFFHSDFVQWLLQNGADDARRSDIIREDIQVMQRLFTENISCDNAEKLAGSL